MTSSKRTYTTANGWPLTDAEIWAMAAEEETIEYDLDKLKARNCTRSSFPKCRVCSMPVIPCSCESDECKGVRHVGALTAEHGAEHMARV